MLCCVGLLFRTVDKLLQRSINKRYPSANSDHELANSFADFYSAKIVRIRDELLFGKAQRGERTMEDFGCTSCFSEFEMVIDEDVLRWFSYSSLAPLLRRVIPLTIPIRGTVLKWFNSYLSQITQFVNINEMNYTVRDLVGVPERSLLGPVLYLPCTKCKSDKIL